MMYSKGDKIQFHNRGEILTGWIDDNVPVYDEHENVLAWLVSCPEFAGMVRVENIIEETA